MIIRYHFMLYNCFLFILSLCNVFTISSFEFSKTNVNYRPMYGMGYEIVNQQLIISKYVTTEIGKPKTRFDEYIDQSDLEVSDDRYFYTKVFEQKKCIIPGSRFLYLFPETSDNMTIGFKGDFENSVYIENTEQEINNDSFISVYYSENLVDYIICISMLKEGSINYDTSLLNKITLYNGVDHLAWNGDVYPWVEGVAGPGIGKTLTIKFNAPSKDIVILNGFVDPT